ncbi:MAG: galactose-1-phosphate uridylyltransferase [Acidobacteriota bacterium]
MTELRRDPVTCHWVLFSSERAKRPSDFEAERKQKGSGDPLERAACPFCPGNEALTPPEVLAYRRHGEANTSGWDLRVVPNKYAALKESTPAFAKATARQRPAFAKATRLRRDSGGQAVDRELFQRMEGVGAHEVIIESRDHGATLASLPLSQLRNVLCAFRDRLREHANDRRIQYVSIYKNQGPEAGASLGHAHSQLLALPVVPEGIRREIEGARGYYLQNERCAFCDIVAWETGKIERLIIENVDYVALAPFASRVPFESWVLPRKHYPRFEQVPEPEYDNLARLLKELFSRLDGVMACPPFNLSLQNLPFRGEGGRSYHWRFEILPVLTKLGGLEWGTGSYINPTVPEEAARALREAGYEAP